MNHSNAHDHYNSLTAEQIIKDVNTCNDKLEALTGARPTLIRCPFGEYDDHVISAIRSIGMEPIQWDVDSLDWKGISAGEITKRVTGKVTNGSIVLFHNAGEHTPEALPDILDYLLGEGYEIVPISKLLLTNEETYIDHTGRQSSKTACAPYKRTEKGRCRNVLRRPFFALRTGGCQGSDLSPEPRGIFEASGALGELRGAASAPARRTGSAAYSCAAYPR